jgi:hypothetical protein
VRGGDLEEETEEETEGFRPSGDESTIEGTLQYSAPWCVFVGEGGGGRHSGDQGTIEGVIIPKCVFVGDDGEGVHVNDFSGRCISVMRACL